MSTNLAILYDGVIGDISERLMTSLEDFRDSISIFDGRDVRGIVQDVTNTAKQLPDKLLEMPKSIQNIRNKLADYVNLPIEIDNLQRIIHEFNNLFIDVKNKTMGIYYVSEALTQYMHTWAIFNVSYVNCSVADGILN